MLVFLPRFGAGGASKVSCVLASRLQQSGVRTTVATLGPGGGRARRFLDEDVPVLPLTPIKGSARGAAHLLAALVPLALSIRRLRPGVLLSAGNHANILCAAAHWLSARDDTNLVLKMTNPIRRTGRGRLRSGLKAVAYRLAIGRASAVLVLSPEDAAEIVAFHPAAANKVQVVSNPYLDSLPASRSPAERTAEPAMLLAVGRLTEQKNFELLLRAAAQLGDRPWRLKVLGQGARLASLQALAKTLGIADRVEFVGYVSDPRPYYREAQALAITSAWEGLPAVAVEALAEGCPVVAVDCSPALSRLITASGAGRLSPASPEAYAAALAQALDEDRPSVEAAALAPFTLESAIRSHINSLMLANASRLVEARRGRGLRAGGWRFGQP
ncbi:glycosyltransferase [Phenylobacterium deserti]|uniref:glycosyltransferase n=1 Tax=Phenylobacterium deserti TaxID=1914756 RepID=UPI0010582CAA|nr:glycosyltransferase [Phenylobacterium deserti]